MITIVSSTNRINSYSSKLAELLNRELKRMGTVSEILNLQQLPPDFSWHKIEDQPHEVFDSLVARYVKNVNKFIFVIPEYNGSYPGILKTFIDSIPPSFFYGKRASLVGLSSGRSGALKGLDDFTGVLHYLQVEVLSDKPRFPQIETLLNAEGELLDENARKRLIRHLEKAVQF